MKGNLFKVEWDNSNAGFKMRFLIYWKAILKTTVTRIKNASLRANENKRHDIIRDMHLFLKANKTNVLE